LDDLINSLIESDDHYRTMEDTLARINELRAYKDEHDNTKIEQYEQELELAEKIYEIRSTREDSSFNWYNNKLPGVFNNPINFMSGFGKTAVAINNANKATG